MWTGRLEVQISIAVKVKFTCRNCGGGDRGRVAIYRPFGELRRAKIVLSHVWCSRPTTGVPLAHATMNFVGLDLTTSDRYIRRSMCMEWDSTKIPSSSRGFTTAPSTSRGSVNFQKA
ncbi:hypothetical protein TNCV_4695301 [Trichonephila clavipes]|nr:hypothetical protein TNCV_4695301 [Trichonephila clavipes]